jgi:hypothetical protein
MNLSIDELEILRLMMERETDRKYEILEKDGVGTWELTLRLEDKIGDELSRKVTAAEKKANVS